MSTPPFHPPSSNLTLLTLPLELRHQIYALTLPSLSTPIQICKSKTKPCPHLCPSRRARCNRQTILERSNDRTLTVQLNLLFVNRQMAAEAVDVYQGMEFVFRSIACLGHLCARLGVQRSHAIKKVRIEGDERLSFDEMDEILLPEGPAGSEGEVRRRDDALPPSQKALLQRIREAFLDADAVVEVKSIGGRALEGTQDRQRHAMMSRPGAGRPRAWNFGAHARGGR